MNHIKMSFEVIRIGTFPEIGNLYTDRFICDQEMQAKKI